MKMGGQDFEYKGDKSKTDENHDADGLLHRRRRRLPQRGRLPVPLRPQERHDHRRRREHLPGRDRGRDPRPPRRRRRRRVRHPGRRHGRADQGRRRAGRRATRPATSWRRRSWSTWPGRLAKFKWPKSIDFTDELPREPTGKLLKRQLRDPYWEGRDRPPSDPWRSVPAHGSSLRVLAFVGGGGRGAGDPGLGAEDGGRAAGGVGHPEPGGVPRRAQALRPAAQAGRRLGGRRPDHGPLRAGLPDRPAGRVDRAAMVLAFTPMFWALGQRLPAGGVHPERLVAPHPRLRLRQGPARDGASASSAPRSASGWSRC